MHSDWERSGASAPKSSQIIREKCIWFLNWRRGEQTCACYLVSFTQLCWLYLHLLFFGSYRSHQEDSKAKITTKTHHKCMRSRNAHRSIWWYTVTGYMHIDILLVHVKKEKSMWSMKHLLPNNYGSTEI